MKNKIPNVNNLVKKTNHDAKISYIDKKYFISSDYNKFMSEILDAKIKEKMLVNTSDISGSRNNSDFE